MNNKHDIKNSIYCKLLQRGKTHPNLCKLWITSLENNPSTQNYKRTLDMLENIATVPDFTKLQILTLYSLVYT